MGGWVDGWVGWVGWDVWVPTGLPMTPENQRRTMPNEMTSSSSSSSSPDQRSNKTRLVV